MEIIQETTINVGLPYSPCGFNCSKPYFFRDIITLLCSQSDVSCNIEQVNTKDYGSFVNGTWRGMAGMVINGTYDIFFSYMNTFDRFSVADFSLPAIYDPVLLITHKPVNIHLSMPGFMGLKWLVWLCIVLTIFVISLILATTVSHKPTLKFCHQAFKECTNLLSILANQSPYFHIIYVSTRFLITFWALCTVIISGFFSGQLLSSLVKLQTVVPFTDFDTFTLCIEQNQCQLITDSFSKDYMQEILYSNLSSFVRLRKSFKTNPVIIEPNDKLILRKILDPTNTKYMTWLKSELSFSAELNGKY